MITRRDVLAAGSASALAALARPAFGAFPPPEQPSIKVGTAVNAMSFLPVYVAYAHTWKAQGLDVQLVQFRGTHIGFVFQQYNLLPALSARDNITLPSDIAGRTVDPSWLATLVELFGLLQAKRN